jgi:hypothetical protein
MLTFPVFEPLSGSKVIPTMAAIAAQFAYALILKKLKAPDEDDYPPGLKFLDVPFGYFYAHTDRFLAFPIAFAWGVAAFRGMDPGFVSLVWGLEAFGLFALALMLRDGWFRYASFIGLAITVLRLIVFDLSRADTIARALAFIGVGALMLAMNALWIAARKRDAERGK